MEGRVQIDRFAVRNFRSIQECDVELSPLTFFIGANASGKTSFVDAILFVASAVRSSLEKAISDRGGLYPILYDPIKLPANTRFDFHLSSPTGFRCQFLLELRIIDGWSVSVACEECRIEDSNGLQHHYVVADGSVKGSAPVFPVVTKDRIFLSNAAGLPEFRLLFDFLAGLGSTEPTPPSAHSVLQKTEPNVTGLRPVNRARRTASPRPQFEQESAGSLRNHPAIFARDSAAV